MISNPLPANINNFSLAIPKRVKIVYMIAAIETAILILFIFSQPMYVRAVHGVWQRWGHHLKWTESLDVHVLLAVLFLCLIVPQFLMGLMQKPRNILNKIHPILGRIIILYTPIFLIASIWNVHVRTQGYLLLEVFFYIVILFVVIFLVRGYLAIKQKNYLKHADSMLGLFILVGVAATARLVYLLLTLKTGSLEVTFEAWVLLSMIVLMGKLLLYYALAGRLRENILILLVATLSIGSVFVIFPWTFYPPLT